MRGMKPPAPVGEGSGLHTERKRGVRSLENA